MRTIEGVLFEAMVKAGAVSQDNADDPVKVRLVPMTRRQGASCDRPVALRR